MEHLRLLIIPESLVTSFKEVSVLYYLFYCKRGRAGKWSFLAA